MWEKICSQNKYHRISNQSHLHHRLWWVWPCMHHIYYGYDVLRIKLSDAPFLCGWISRGQDYNNYTLWSCQVYNYLYLLSIAHASFQTVGLCWSASPEERPDFAHFAQVFQSLVESHTVSQSSHPYYVNLANNHPSQCNGNGLPPQ